MLTDQEITDLNLLIKGDRYPENGMERHFLRCLKGDSSPCTEKEREWFNYWSSSNLVQNPHIQSRVEQEINAIQDSVNDPTQLEVINKVSTEKGEEINQYQGSTIKKDEIQIDGINIVRWVVDASPDDLSLLVLAEYSDKEDILVIRAAKHSGLTVVKIGSSGEIIRPINSFKTGTFFFGSDNGERIRNLISNSLSPSDKRVIEANNYLLAHGFLVSELGGDSPSLILADAIKNFEEHEEVPDGDNWNNIHALLIGRPIAVQRCAVKYISTWICHLENKKPEGFDVYKRVLLATLLRHSGQLDKSLEVSRIVELPHRRLLGTNSSISVLCTVRAATLMDIAEAQPNKMADLLKQTRLILNKANAMSGGDHIEILNTYQRLNKLEKRF